MSNRTYDVLKWIALIGLPAFATFYATLGQVWGLPLATEITATIVALDTFLGTVLGVSSIKYNSGDSSED